MANWPISGYEKSRLLGLENLFFRSTDINTNLDCSQMIYLFTRYLKTTRTRTQSKMHSLDVKTHFSHCKSVVWSIIAIWPLMSIQMCRRNWVSNTTRRRIRRSPTSCLINWRLLRGTSWGLLSFDKIILYWWPKHHMGISGKSQWYLKLGPINSSFQGLCPQKCFRCLLKRT